MNDAVTNDAHCAAVHMTLGPVSNLLACMSGQLQSPGNFSLVGIPVLSSCTGKTVADVPSQAVIG